MAWACCCVTARATRAGVPGLRGVTVKGAWGLEPAYMGRGHQIGHGRPAETAWTSTGTVTVDQGRCVVITLLA